MGVIGVIRAYMSFWELTSCYKSSSLKFTNLNWTQNSQGFIIRDKEESLATNSLPVLPLSQ